MNSFSDSFREPPSSPRSRPHKIQILSTLLAICRNMKSIQPDPVLLEAYDEVEATLSKELDKLRNDPK